MLAAVSSREISEWQAFEAEHGPIWLRADWTGALVRFTLANLWEQTPEQMATIFEMTAAAERAREAQAGGST
jgi:hypothetical protein